MFLKINEQTWVNPDHVAIVREEDKGGQRRVYIYLSGVENPVVMPPSYDLKQTVKLISGQA